MNSFPAFSGNCLCFGLIFSVSYHREENCVVKEVVDRDHKLQLPEQFHARPPTRLLPQILNQMIPAHQHRVYAMFERYALARAHPAKPRGLFLYIGM